MTDVYPEEKRSAIMSRIRSKNTKPEVFVRKLLFDRGFRFRIHKTDLPGRPDVVLPKWRTVVFVHGCFWHAHEGCRRAAKPASHADFWAEKLAKNKARDREVAAQLAAAGWRVLVVWECACRAKYAGALSDRMEVFIREGRASAGEIGREDLEVQSRPGSSTP